MTNERDTSSPAAGVEAGSSLRETLQFVVRYLRSPEPMPIGMNHLLADRLEALLSAPVGNDDK